MREVVQVWYEGILSLGGRNGRRVVVIFLEMKRGKKSSEINSGKLGVLVEDKMWLFRALGVNENSGRGFIYGAWKVFEDRFMFIKETYIISDNNFNRVKC